MLERVSQASVRAAGGDDLLQVVVGHELVEYLGRQDGERRDGDVEGGETGGVKPIGQDLAHEEQTRGLAADAAAPDLREALGGVEERPVETRHVEVCRMPLAHRSARSRNPGR